MGKIIWYDIRMTSNTTPAPYVASASSSSSQSNFPAWEAFNGTYTGTSDRWRSETGSTSGWLQLDFGKTTPIDRFEIKGATGSTAVIAGSPTSYSLTGSNNGTSWTQLGAFNTHAFTSSDSLRVFILPKAYDFRYYRLHVSSPQSANDFVTVGYIKYGFEEPVNKSLILHNGEYKKYNTTSKKWESSVLNNIQSEGVDSLTTLLDRKITTLNPLPMTNKSEILNGGSGKVFSKTLDLKKYLDIRSINVEVK